MNIKSPESLKPHTPSLKRTQLQHSSLKSCPRLSTTPSLPFRDNKSIMSVAMLNSFDSGESQLLKSNTFQKPSDVSTCDINSQSKQIKAGVAFIHGQIGKFVKEDLYHSIKSKDQFHKYEERQLLGEVWVDETKLIPKIVYCAIKKEKEKTQDKEGKINYSQGLLPKSGFMYFAIENKIIFFDAETMDQNSEEAVSLELQDRPLSALFHIQQLELGPPYLNHKQQVLVFLHPYEAQIYHFEVELPFRTNSPPKLDKNMFSGRADYSRKLMIQGLNIRLPLPHQRPCPLVKTMNGKLYCTNQQGSLCCIQFDQALFSGKKELSIRKLSSSLRSFWQGTTKMLTTNLKYFGKTIKNYTSSFFPTKLYTQIVYDSNRQLLIVFVRKQSKQPRQQLHVYQQSKQKKLYSLVDEQFLGKESAKELVLDIIVLQDKLNSDCNTAIYMNSGKRIYLDLNQDKIRKCVIHQPPILGHRRFGDKIHLNIGSQQMILQQNYSMHLFYYDKKWTCALTDQQNRKYERVSTIKVKTSSYNKTDDQTYRLYHQEPRQIGPIKKLLAGGKTALIKSFCQSVREIYYQPQEILYTTDLVTQRIKILRPIDIFFSLYSSFEMSCSPLIQTIKTALNGFQIEDYICFCTQIFTDSQGIYLINHDLGIQYCKKMGLPMKQFLKIFKNRGIQSIRYSEITKDMRKKLMQLMMDLLVQSGQKSKEQKQQIMIFGIAKYVARLLRIVWESSINDISKDMCIAVIGSLRQSSDLLNKLKVQMRSENKSFIWQMQCWIERVKQFFLFVSSQSSLPEMKTSEALLVQPEYFHKCLFLHLTKHCQPNLINQLSQLIPIYCSAAFVQVFKLWREVNSLKQSSKIVQICNRHNSLPQYFIQYLQRIKGITQLRTKNNQYIEPKQQTINQNNFVYRDLIKMIQGSFSRLQDKERLLSQADKQLRKENGDLKQSRSTLQNGLIELRVLHAQIKMQMLIKQEYIRQSKANSLKEQHFNFFLSKNKQNINETISVIECLERVLFDQQILSDCIDQLDKNQLRLVHTFYFNSLQFPSYLSDVVDQIYTLFCEDSVKLIEIYKDQINFMIVVAKLPLEIDLLLTIYIERMLNSPRIMKMLEWQQDCIDSLAFWPLCFCTEIGLSPQKIYLWTIDKIKFQNNEQRYEYLMMCCLYLVIDYLPIKNQELGRVYNSKFVDSNPSTSFNILFSKLQKQQ